MQARSASKGIRRPDERLASLFTPQRVDSSSAKHVEEPMKILIGVDGSAASLDAVRMAGRLVDPSRDEVAVYFSPMELEKRLIGRSRRIIDGAAAALFEEACSLLPSGFAKPTEMIASSKSAAVGLLEAAAG
jgi:hypothetical protein